MVPHNDIVAEFEKLSVKLDMVDQTKMILKQNQKTLITTRVYSKEQSMSWVELHFIQLLSGSILS